MDIIDYSKLDRDTIEFLVNELKKEIVLNPLMQIGLERALLVLDNYWRKSLESQGKKSIL